MSDQSRGDMDRRQALKVLAIAAAAPAVFGACEPGGDAEPGGGGTPGEGGASQSPPTPPTPATNPLAAGTPTDPDLLRPVIRWERTLTAPELATLAVLSDAIIPADDRSPSASALGAHDFIDEWVSAPYEFTKKDGVLVRGGLAWLDAESARRFDAPFVDLTTAQRTAICDDISYGPEAAPEFTAAARFFDKVRDLTATAFYTTREGMEDVGYVGNVPQATWGPPPIEALRHVGLA